MYKPHVFLLLRPVYSLPCVDEGDQPEEATLEGGAKGSLKNPEKSCTMGNLEDWVRGRGKSPRIPEDKGLLGFPQLSAKEGKVIKSPNSLKFLALPYPTILQILV